MGLTSDITLDELKKHLPSRKNLITQELVDMINDSRNEPEFQGESLLQTVAGYEGLLSKHKATVGELIRACKFCAYLVSQNDNATEAYKKTFADREFVRHRMGLSTSDSKYNELTSAATRYKSSKLVVDILTYSQMPMDLFFMGERYKAVGILAKEMVGAPLSKDRIAAAKELLAATKGPENLKIALDVGVAGGSMIATLNDQLNKLAETQFKQLKLGENIKEVQKLGIKLNDEEVIDAETDEV